jgi:hypothetical protein
MAKCDKCCRMTTWISKNLRYSTGWWFGTFFIFPDIGNNHPNWLIFFRGAETTNQLRYSKISHVRRLG